MPHFALAWWAIFLAMASSSSRDVAAAAAAGGLDDSRQQHSPPKFDLDTDVAPIRVANEMGDAIRESISPHASDASLVTRITVLTANSFFDAIAPYHDTAVGIYSDLGRRPAKERTGYRNKNIAVLYCSLRVLANAIPDQRPRFVSILEEAGLDPNDVHESTSDAAGIGNTCGRKINEFRDSDGMNSKGDYGGASVYNRKPYWDYTGYKPVNTFDEVKDPRRWQPAVITANNGIFKIQKYVTPQIGRTKPYSIPDVDKLQAKPHGRLMKGLQGQKLYKKTTDEIIAISASLTDEQKMAAELFDDKLKGFGHSFGARTLQDRKLTYDEFVFLETVTNIATFDASIIVWKEKSRWDAVRPFTAIRYLYGDSPLTAYGGKGKGTVNDIPASAWDSYMPVADHPEYPSTTAAVCAAFAQSSTIWKRTDKTGLGPVRYAQGVSRREPGITPSKDITLSFPTWADFERLCGDSRLWGGVHFADAVNEGIRLGRDVGKLAVKFVQCRINPKKPTCAPTKKG